MLTSMPLLVTSFTVSFCSFSTTYPTPASSIRVFGGGVQVGGNHASLGRQCRARELLRAAGQVHHGRVSLPTDVRRLRRGGRETAHRSDRHQAAQPLRDTIGHGALHGLMSSSPAIIT